MSTTPPLLVEYATVIPAPAIPPLLAINTMLPGVPALSSAAPPPAHEQHRGATTSNLS
jgi:hypothetical protein